MDLERLAWPLDALPTALEALAVESGLPLRRDPLPQLPDLKNAQERQDAAQLDDLLEGWLRSATRARGLDVEGTAPSFEDFPAFLRKGGPAMVLLFGVERLYLLVLLGAEKEVVRLLTPQQKEERCRVSEIHELLLSEWLRATQQKGKFLEAIGLTYKAQESLRRMFLEELLAPQEAAFAWMLHPPASSPLPQQLRMQRLGSPLTLLFLSAVGSTVLSLLAWFTVGSNALTGRVDSGRLVAWSLVLLMTAPLAGLATHAQGQLALRTSLTLRRIMLRGCIQLSADEVKSKGLGHQLALVNESSLVEQFAISSAFGLLIATINLSSSGYLFWASVGTRHLTLLLLGWCVMAAIGASLLYRERLRWTELRLGLTNDLIAKMSGYRTRRVQQPPALWHEGEDEQIADYWQASRQMDGTSVRFQLLPRLWLVFGVMGTFPVLLSSESSSLLLVMVGLLLSYQALQTLLSSLQPVINLILATRLLRGPVLAAQKTDDRPITFLAPSPQRQQSSTPIIELIDVIFRYRPQGAPLLQNCSLSIYPGERILLEGSSGSGKSTLISILGGLRTPESGLVLVADSDHHSLNSEAWRRVVAIAPQFHENHIYANTMAFNLLMGRRWPPSAQDIEEAEALCEELGLGPLLQRMPNGLTQNVGENGWQLSHGEKSRVFIARALLQRADVLVLDESFGALDPETLELCMATVLRHSKTLIVIAHP
ncbi:MAG: ATP-binding cassette domain-containing protein [Polyangiaceae bacterium]|jgi:ATP-binding cassette subfamily B protein|nr:ATP-binding cassette domain-containing protein [Polyangiaceae bacterium]